MEDETARIPLIVHLSRYTPNLEKMWGVYNGKHIRWEKGESVRIMEGADENRIFIIDSETMGHAAAPGEPVREGWFEDDPGRRVCKRERQMWFVS